MTTVIFMCFHWNVGSEMLNCCTVVRKWGGGDCTGAFSCPMDSLAHKLFSWKE